MLHRTRTNPFIRILTLPPHLDRIIIRHAHKHLTRRVPRNRLDILRMPMLDVNHLKVQLQERIRPGPTPTLLPEPHRLIPPTGRQHATVWIPRHALHLRLVPFQNSQRKRLVECTAVVVVVDDVVDRVVRRAAAAGHAPYHHRLVETRAGEQPAVRRKCHVPHRSRVRSVERLQEHRRARVRRRRNLPKRYSPVGRARREDNPALAYAPVAVPHAFIVTIQRVKQRELAMRGTLNVRHEDGAEASSFSLKKPEFSCASHTV